MVLDVKKRNALPVYDRDNIHLIENEHLDLIRDDHVCFSSFSSIYIFFFFNITFRNQR